MTDYAVGDFIFVGCNYYNDEVLEFGIVSRIVEADRSLESMMDGTGEEYRNPDGFWYCEQFKDIIIKRPV